MGDNLNENQIVQITGITNTIEFASSEKAGKKRPFEILKDNILFYEDIFVNVSSNRRVAVKMTLEGVEEV